MATLLGLVWRFRGVIQVAIPAVVAVDTVHSFYKCHQLYQQRLQDWRQEEEQEVYSQVVRVLQQATRRCQQRDKDFWPSSLTVLVLIPLRSASEAPAPAGAPATPGSAPPGTGNASDAEGAALDPAVGDVATFLQQCLGLAALEPADGGDPPLEIAPAVQAASAAQAGTAGATALPGAVTAGLSMDSELPGPHMHDPYGPDKQPTNGQQPAGSRWRSWLPSHASLAAVWTGLGGAVAALRQPRETAQCVRSVLAARYTRCSHWLDEQLSAAGDALQARYSGRLPWPQAHLSRRSALRCRIHWHGLRWPVRSQRGSGVELLLDGL